MIVVAMIIMSIIVMVMVIIMMILIIIVNVPLTMVVCKQIGVQRCMGTGQLAPAHLARSLQRV